MTKTVSSYSLEPLLQKKAGKGLPRVTRNRGPLIGGRQVDGCHNRSDLTRQCGLSEWLRLDAQLLVGLIGEGAGKVEVARFAHGR